MDNNSVKEEQQSLSIELTKVRCLNNDEQRIKGMRDFILLVEQSEIPTFLKERFKINAQREIESVAVRHADIDIL